MKNFIVTIALIFFLASCTEDDVKPDPFPGSWSFASGDLALSFDVQKIDNGAYNIVNRSVSHPSLPPEEQGNNQAITYDKFANGNGYGRIEINSRGNVNYYVHLIYNRFNDEGNMNVYDIIVQMPGQEQYVLMDQVLIKK